MSSTADDTYCDVARELSPNEPSTQQRPPQPSAPNHPNHNTNPARHQYQWPLGHLTGIPAHLLGVAWVFFASACWANAYMWDRSPWVRLAKEVVPWCELFVAMFLVILQILSAYRIAVLASSEQWHQPIRVAVPFVKALMIFWYVVLIASLLASTMLLVCDLARDQAYDMWPPFGGCLFSGIAALHYLVILVGKLSRGKISLHLAFENPSAMQGQRDRSEAPVEPYRDSEEHVPETGAVATIA